MDQVSIEEQGQGTGTCLFTSIYPCSVDVRRFSCVGEPSPLSEAFLHFFRHSVGNAHQSSPSIMAPHVDQYPHIKTLASVIKALVRSFFFQFA